MSVQQVPPEIWSKIFTLLPFCDKVTSRLVSKAFKLYAEASLSRIKVIYAGRSETLSYFRLPPFLSHQEKVSFAQEPGNFLKLQQQRTEDSFSSPQLNEKTLIFINTYCTSLEGLVTSADIPFPLLARTIGHRLKFFKISSGKILDSPHTVEDIEKMTKVQFFSGEYLPCPFEFIRSSIQLISVNLICYNGCPICCNHNLEDLASILPNNLVSLGWRSEGKKGNALVYPSFSNKLQYLDLVMYNDKLSFSFPNLISFSVIGARDDRWDELFDSLKNSHNLKSLSVSAIQDMNLVMDKLWPILKNFKSLKTLALKCMRNALNIPIDLTDKMIDTIALHLPNLTIFRTQGDLYEEEQLIKLRQRMPRLQIKPIF